MANETTRKAPVTRSELESAYKRIRQVTSSSQIGKVWFLRPDGKPDGENWVMRDTLPEALELWGSSGDAVKDRMYNEATRAMETADTGGGLVRLLTPSLMSYIRTTIRQRFPHSVLSDAELSGGVLDLAAKGARLMLLSRLVSDMPYGRKDEYEAFAALMWKVWGKGYVCVGDIDGRPCVVDRPLAKIPDIGRR